MKTGLVPKIIRKTREQTYVYISVSKSAVTQQFSVKISEKHASSWIKFAEKILLKQFQLLEKTFE